MLALVVVCVALASAAMGQEGRTSTSGTGRYDIITENNIFLKNRARPTRRLSTSSYVTSRPRSARVLRGIVGQGDTYVAFFEDSRGGTSVVAADTVLAEGRVTQVAADHVVVKRGEETFTIPIGGTLEGPPTSVPVAPGPTPASTGAAAGATSDGTTSEAPPSGSTPPGATSSTDTSVTPSSPPSTPSASSLESIRERLRKRREQEMKKK